jgi:hypothetical protein
LHTENIIKKACFTNFLKIASFQINKNKRKINFSIDILDSDRQHQFKMHIMALRNVLEKKARMEWEEFV